MFNVLVKDLLMSTGLAWLLGVLDRCLALVLHRLPLELLGLALELLWLPLELLRLPLELLRLPLELLGRRLPLKLLWRGLALKLLRLLLVLLWVDTRRRPLSGNDERYRQQNPQNPHHDLNKVLE